MASGMGGFNKPLVASLAGVAGANRWPHSAQNSDLSSLETWQMGHSITSPPHKLTD